MKLAWSEIGGVPIKQVRDILRDLRHRSQFKLICRRADIVEAARSAGVAPTTARKLADALIAEGLFEPYHPPADKERSYQRYSKGGPYFHLTRLGISLTATKMFKRFDRARADPYIAELLSRADAINAHSDLLYRVKAIWVYGSYLTDAADLGDIDLAGELENKHPELHDDERSALNLTRVAARGRKEQWNDMWSFGEHEVEALLRGRCPYLSLRFEGLDPLYSLDPPPAFKQIYPRDTGTAL